MFGKFLLKTKNSLYKYWKYFLIGISLIFLFSLIRNISRISDAKETVDTAKQRIEQLRLENEELEKQVEKVATEAFIEKNLRDKLGLAKEEEIVVVLPDEEILKRLVPQREEEEVFLPDPIWKKWLKLFL